MADLTNVLEALNPHVWVAGSHARGTTTDQSDIDLTPRTRDDYDPDADGRQRRERLMPEIIDTLDRLNVPWHSPMMGYIVVRVDGMQVEVGEPMAHVDPDDTPDTHLVNVQGVAMVALGPSWLSATSG